MDSLATPITPELQADNLSLASCSLYNDNDMFAWSLHAIASDQHIL